MPASQKVTSTQPTKLCQIKIALNGIRPQIWRRLVVPHDLPLEVLHEVFQVALGWTNSHLHKFGADGIWYRISDEDDFDGLDDDEVDEDTATLAMIAHSSRCKFAYIYDFGDYWEHSVAVEKLLPFWAVPNAPLCLDGANSVPPEDCGGIPGYSDLRRILQNPRHSEYADMRRWAGRFDPTAFDLEDVNKRLEMYRKKRRLTAKMLPDVRGKT